MDAGCSDGRFVLTTDDQGYFVDRSLPADSPDSVSCYHVERPFGWLPTGRVINFRISAGSTPYPFTFRDLGRNVMEMSGEFIVSGLPAALGDPGVAKPHRDCGHSFLIFYTESEVQAAVIVDGADSQTGCFAPGDLVTPGDTGAPAGVPIPFEPGTSVGTTFLSGEDSMRFHATDVSSASVLDIGAGRLTENCAVVIPVDGFVPPGYARVFILPEKYRPGCGASGRLVRLYRDREPLEPTFEWRAGSTEMGPFLLAPANVVRPPDTGSAGLVPGSHRGAGD